MKSNMILLHLRLRTSILKIKVPKYFSLQMPPMMNIKSITIVKHSHTKFLIVKKSNFSIEAILNGFVNSKTLMVRFHHQKIQQACMKTLQNLRMNSSKQMPEIYCILKSTFFLYLKFSKKM